jgi:hypothetical protein
MRVRDVERIDDVAKGVPADIIIFHLQPTQIPRRAQTDHAARRCIFARIVEQVSGHARQIARMHVHIRDIV